MEPNRGDATTRRHWFGAAGLFIALTWITILTRTAEPAPAEPVERPDLHVWDLPGCYQLVSQPTEDEIDVVLPEHLFLAADSVDQWGRTQDTYRAEPLDADSAAAPYRWFVRADTLWVVWSEGALRGGLALRASGDGLLGRARVAGSGDGDATARVQAWKVNCSTRAIESAARVRR